jgi:mono/diheme cytochrome c family protein
MSAFASRVRLLALGALLLVTAADVHADDPQAVSKSKLSASKGAEIYSHICQGCHMPSGQGAAGAGAYPQLASNPALASWQYIAVTVLNGRKAMPPFGIAPGSHSMNSRAVLLSDAQIADVVNYVRSSFGNRYKDKVTAAQVADLPHPTITAMF